MEDVSKDPIIEFYLRMSKSPDYEIALPVFSETRLRLAFKEILGKLRQINMNELHLYRKLLLFHYSEHYKSVKDLMTIMSCFNEKEFNECLEYYADTIKEWRQFIRDNLRNILRKEAFVEILYEWARRALFLNGDLLKEDLHRKAFDVRAFLNWDAKYLKPCLKTIENRLLNRNAPKKGPVLKGIDSKDLALRRVFDDIRPKLSPMVIENLPSDCVALQRNTSEKSAKKKMNVGEIEVLDIQVLDPETSCAEKANEPGEPPEKCVKLDNATQGKESFTNVIIMSKEKELFNEHITIKLKEVHDGKQEEDIDDEDDESVELLDVVDLETESSSSDTEDRETNSSGNCAIANNVHITLETAMSYISALQAFSVVNGHIGAINYLDKIDSIFRNSVKK